MDRQRLASGNELLTVTGRVINPTSTEQPVPPLQAQLKSRAGKLVYSWTIAPPARTLPPGASASFNSAEVNVPAGRRRADHHRRHRQQLKLLEFDQAGGLAASVLILVSARRRLIAGLRAAVRSIRAADTIRTVALAWAVAPARGVKLVAEASDGGGKDKHGAWRNARRRKW